MLSNFGNRATLCLKKKKYKKIARYGSGSL